MTKLRFTINRPSGKQQKKPTTAPTNEENLTTNPVRVAEKFFMSRFPAFYAASLARALRVDPALN
jgi:hypothetical protein